MNISSTRTVESMSIRSTGLSGLSGQDGASDWPARFMLSSTSLNPAVFHFPSLQGSRALYEIRESTSNGSDNSSTDDENQKRGQGMFATQAIPAGTRIVADAPLLLLRDGEDLPDLWRAWNALGWSEAARREFLSSHAARHDPERDAVLREKLRKRTPALRDNELNDMVALANVFYVNAFGLVLSGDHEHSASTQTHARALSPAVARINHSCAPNAHACFIEARRTSAMVVHATRDIPAGTEIEIAYFSILLPREERQRRAVAWGFECMCVACSLPSPQRELRLASIRAMTEQLTGLFDAMSAGSLDPFVAQLEFGVEAAQRMVDTVLRDESLMPQLPIALDYLASLRLLLHASHPHIPAILDVAVHDLERAMLAEICITGHDSAVTQTRRDKWNSYRKKRG